MDGFVIAFLYFIANFLMMPTHIFGWTEGNFFLFAKYWKQHNWMTKIWIVVINIICIPIMLVDAILCSFIFMFINSKDEDNNHE